MKPDIQAIPCKICGAASVLFDTLDFARSCNASTAAIGVPVHYHRCTGCGFTFTRFFDAFTPTDWTERVYNADYAAVDPEFAQARPLRNAMAVRSYFGDLREAIIGLDFGGGNGTAAAALRRAGWSFDSLDPFGAAELTQAHAGRYSLCTAFEVFEHLPDPEATLREIVVCCSSGPLVIVVGTWLSDGHADVGLQDWCYAAPRNGHISLFSRRSLELLAQRCGLEFASLNGKTHALYRGHERSAIERRLRWGRVRMLARRLFPSAAFRHFPALRGGLASAQHPGAETIVSQRRE